MDYMYGFYDYIITIWTEPAFILVEPQLESKLFHFHYEFRENAGKLVKSTPTPLANLNPPV